MAPNFNDYRTAESHRQDLLREAEQLRRSAAIEEAARAARPRRPIYAPLLARLGQWMIVWGTHLRTQAE